MQWLKERKLCLTFPLLLVFLFSLLVPVYATSINDLREEQREKQKAIEVKQKEIREIKAKEQDTLEDLKSIRGSIETLSAELEEIGDQLSTVEGEVTVAEEELADAEARLEERSEVLNDRVRTIYENGTVGYLEVLLNSESFSDFLNRLEFLRKIAEQDSELIREIKTEREQITERKAELERKKAQIQLLQDRAERNKTELDRQEELEGEKLVILQSDRTAAERERKQLEADNRKVEELIRKKLEEEARKNGTKPSMGSGGIYNWPVPGYSRISSPYGWRTHPIFGTKSFHSGLDIPAPTGSTVAAAENGEVIYAGTMGGYGNVVILDHGGGMSTLYAHLSSFNTSVGSVVSKGQRIAGIGSTGWSTGPHLHFEVRISGKHTNPWSYLK